jgi:hypothetical protein
MCALQLERHLTEVTFVRPVNTKYLSKTCSISQDKLEFTELLCDRLKLLIHRLCDRVGCRCLYLCDGALTASPSAAATAAVSAHSFYHNSTTYVDSEISF